MPSSFAAFACVISAMNSQGKAPQGKAQTPGVWPDPLILGKRMVGAVESGSFSTITYTDGVKVIYGVTTLVADTVTVDRLGRHGVAKGHVHVTDPDVTMDAAEL